MGGGVEVGRIYDNRKWFYKWWPFTTRKPVVTMPGPRTTGNQSEVGGHVTLGDGV